MGVYICANCKPVFVQKLKEDAKLNANDLNYAGFWIRVFAAKLLDGIILALVLVLPLVVVGHDICIAPLQNIQDQSSFNFDSLSHTLLLTPPRWRQIFSACFFDSGSSFQQVFYSSLLFWRDTGENGLWTESCGFRWQQITYGRTFRRGCFKIKKHLAPHVGYIIAGFDNPQEAAGKCLISPADARVVYE